MAETRENNSNTSKNFQFITLLQMTGCLLVIFGHSYPFAVEIPSGMLKIREFIYLFHMCLFVWCSGYLFIGTKQTSRHTFPEFALRRAKRLLVPYVIFSVLGLIPKIILSNMNLINDDIKLDGTFPKALIRMFLVPRENVWGHFWFIPMIFFIGLTGFGLSKLIEKLPDSYGKICWLSISVLTVFVSYFSVPCGKWFGVNDILKYFWVYAFGCFCAFLKYEPDKNGKIAISVLSVAIAVLMFVLQKDDGFLIQINKVLVPALMIVALSSVCKLLSSRIRISRKSLSARTYSVFILSWPVQQTVEIILERILHLPMYVVTPGMSGGGIAISLLALKIIDAIETKFKISLFSKMLGEANKNEKIFERTTCMADTKTRH